jgi:hypothetical protein
VGNQFPYPVTLVELSQGGQNLVYINKSFLAETLYLEEEIIGTNCRFLQGSKTDMEAVARIRSAISDFKPICQDLVNYKKNGEIFFNRLVLIPFKEKEKKFFLGLQHVINEEKFKPEAYMDQIVIDDRTKNPLTIIVFSFIHPEANREKHLLEEIERLRTFVLNL